MSAPLIECLLARMMGGQSMSLEELVHDLEIGRELLEQMLWDLERGGYIQVQHTCRDGCQKCAYRGACHAAPGGRIWVVTEKGRRSVEHSRNPHAKGNVRTEAFALCTTCAHDE